jgi:hypothetical protein
MRFHHSLTFYLLPHEDAQELLRSPKYKEDLHKNHRITQQLFLGLIMIRFSQKIEN